MPLPGPAGESPGGVLRLFYRNTTTGAVHAFTLHVAWFDQTPSGSSNDRLYIPGGPVTPTESGLLATFTAVGGLWAPYYNADWSLEIDSLWLNSAGTLTYLSNPPTTAPIVGMSTEDALLPRLDRVIRLLGRNGARRELWLQEVTAPVENVTVEVTSTSGGIDSRDQAWINYLAGNTGGGIVMPDGTYAFGVTDMKVWWARRPFELAAVTGAPGPPGPTGPPGSTGPQGPPGPDSNCCGPDTTPITPTQVPIDYCPAIVCGAAGQMAGKLVEQYNLIRGLLLTMVAAPFVIRLIGVAPGELTEPVILRVLRALIDWLGIRGTPTWIIQTLRAVLEFVGFFGISTKFLHDFEELPTDAYQALRGLVVPCLGCADNMFLLSKANLTCWEAAILADTGEFDEFQRNLLVYCLQFTPFNVYSETAAAGAAHPSWACAVARQAMTGGAILGLAARQAMTGGAVLALTGPRAMTGGTFLPDAKPGHSVSGGAVTT